MEITERLFVKSYTYTNFLRGADKHAMLSRTPDKTKRKTWRLWPLAQSTSLDVPTGSLHHGSIGGESVGTPGACGYPDLKPRPGVLGKGFGL